MRVSVYILILYIAKGFIHMYIFVWQSMIICQITAAFLFCIRYSDPITDNHLSATTHPRTRTATATTTTPATLH